MKYLGLDLGTKTLGVAISDRCGIIANIYRTISFVQHDYDQLLPILKDIVTNEQITKIVLGLPKNMDGSISERGNITISFQKKLESYLGIEVVLEDERWTTKQANKILLEADLSRKKRKTKIDQIAATIILQSYLDRRRKGNK
ncbi:MAG: Holliday junction resolvase RuvX [Bacilli bacterium]|jgi:putative Holliday junction resolvase|nr:Holliday junction resolvase RuvX [Bacilli bacterium]